MQRLDQFHRGTCTVASYHERSHVVELSLQTHGYVLNGDANLTHFVHSIFFVKSRRRHTRCGRDWSSDVCSSDLPPWDLFVRGDSRRRESPRTNRTQGGSCPARTPCPGAPPRCSPRGGAAAGAPGVPPRP